MNSIQKRVKKFHQEFGITINEIPTVPSKKDCILRVRLILEELLELTDHLGLEITTIRSTIKTVDNVSIREKYLSAGLGTDLDTLSNIADDLGDLLYIVYGSGVTLGIDLAPVFTAVHKSNMSKVGGRLDEFGKYIKPETYKPPKLQSVIARQFEFHKGY